MKPFNILTAALVMAAPQVSLCAQQPADGRAVLQQMRSAYDGKWYHTLTFVQRTVFHRPDGTTNTQMWYEAVSGPSNLRIDRDSVTSGNGTLYKGDSTFVVRNGAVASRNGNGNPFMPLIMGVYLQPVERTAQELAKHGMDLAKVHRNTWHGRQTWVVGADAPSDTTSPQFWIDTERLVLVRMLIRVGSGATYDMDVDGYERAGNGWLGTRIIMSSGGRPVQEEHYQDWKVDVELDPALFDTATWTSARHWWKGRVGGETVGGYAGERVSW
jgi:hypothetical protein